VHGLLIDTKVDDLGWPWTAISNIRRISRNLADTRQMALMAAAIYDNITSFFVLR